VLYVNKSGAGKMSAESNVREQPQNYTPEEAALLIRLRVFVNMRWLQILGVLGATIGCLQSISYRFPHDTGVHCLYFCSAIQPGIFHPGEEPQKKPARTDNRKGYHLQ